MKELKDISDQHAIEVAKIAFLNTLQLDQESQVDKEEVQIGEILREPTGVFIDACVRCWEGQVHIDQKGVVWFMCDDSQPYVCDNVIETTDYLRQFYNIPNLYSPTVEGAEDEGYSIMQEALLQIVRYQPGFAEYFMQHNYRELHELSKIVIGIANKALEEASTLYRAAHHPQAPKRDEVTALKSLERTLEDEISIFTTRMEDTFVSDKLQGEYKGRKEGCEFILKCLRSLQSLPSSVPAIDWQRQTDLWDDVIAVTDSNEPEEAIEHLRQIYTISLRSDIKKEGDPC